VDVRTLVEIIRARWKIVIAAIAACLLGAMAITALQTKNYQSSATVLMSFSGATSISEFFEATQTSEQRQSSYAEIAGGRTVAQRAIKQLGLPMSADELVKKTKITYTPESLLFRVTGSIRILVGRLR
jgi:capsular polysaccharide biosynthesis protein